MARITLGIRLTPAERAALKQAARDDDRTMSSFARKILVDWLTLKGRLEPSIPQTSPGMKERSA